MGSGLFARVLEALTLTLLLTWLWGHGFELAYLKFVTQAAAQILGIFGQPPIARMRHLPEHFLQHVSFLALMLIMPRTSIKRRMTATVWGCVLIFLGHVVLASAVHFAYAKHGYGAGAVSRFFPVLLLTDSLPIILWAFFSRDFLLSIGETRDVAGGSQRPAGSTDEGGYP